MGTLFRKVGKKITIVFCLAQIIAVFCLGYWAGKKTNTTDKVEQSDMKNSAYVSGAFASYKYIDRKLSLDYFYKVDSASTYEQIVDEIGEPNGEFGSGMIYRYYEIEDDLYVSLSFICSEKYLENVNLVQLCTGKEILDVIFPDIDGMLLQE